jgi:hypothetical protein
MMDPFDDFEFKPLTEGLGFNKKADKIKSEIKSVSLGHEMVTRAVPEVPLRSLLHSPTPEPVKFDRDARPATQSISDLIASLPPSLDFVEEKKEAFSEPPQIFQPLGRDDYKLSEPTLGAVLPAPIENRAGRGGSNVSSSYRERLDQSFARAFPHAEQPPKSQIVIIEGPELVPTSANFAAGLLDAMVAAGVAMISLVAILAITHINLMALLTNASTDSQTQVYLGLLFVAILQLYMLAARSFFGTSLGEWAFELQVGTNAQQDSNWYPALVVWRSLLVTATGLVVLPLLSLIFRRDLTAYLTGLQLYRRQ